MHLVGAVGDAQRAGAAGTCPASGRSFDTPAAPHTWIARSTTRWYAAGTNTLMAEMSVRASPVAAVDPLGGVDGHQPGRLDVDVAVGDEALDELLVLHAARRAPGGCIARSTIRSKARHIWPTRVHAVEDPPGAEAVLGGLVALAHPPERVLERAPARPRRRPRSGRTSDAPHADAPHDVHARRVGRHDDLHHLARAAGLAACRRWTRHITMKKSACDAVRREPLVAVDHPVVAVAHGASCRASGDRSRGCAARSSRSPTPWSPRPAAAATSASAPRCRTSRGSSGCPSSARPRRTAQPAPSA